MLMTRPHRALCATCREVGISRAHPFEPKVGWNSAADDIVNGFYRPALRHCERYDRLAGYFNSSAFAVVMREILDFVERGGKMRLGTGVNLLPADIDVMKKSVEGALVQKTDEMFKDDLGSKCLAVLARMLSTEIDHAPQLEIKLFVPKNGGIYHPKTGVFTMSNGDRVSFSGSVNETGAGWARNVEEFKTFCEWNNAEAFKIDVDTFRDFWNDRHPSLHTYDLPAAVRQNILKAKADSEAEYREILADLRRKVYGSCGGKVDPDTQQEFDLYDYQKEAVEAWASRGHRGILEMPTAVGKTFTALGCINRLQRDGGRLFTVVAVPYNHLAQQWIDTIRYWNRTVPEGMKISTNLLNIAKDGKWEEWLAKTVADFNRINMSGRHLVDDCIVCTTYDKLARPEFIDSMEKISGGTLLVADEAHNVGSAVRRNGLTETYSSRLALTATPERYFDEEGSELIRSYFGGVSYFMDIGEAIRNGYLTPYDYHPVFAELNSAEIEEYRKLTRLIAQKLYGSDGVRDDQDDLGSGPENKRARLVAKAEQKYSKLVEILEAYGGKMDHALVYCQDNVQLDRVVSILTDRHVFSDKITHATKMMKRRETIRSLEEEKHDCIVSMRCLDEGVDIPSARLGIIMASTGNRLQYIQRRGRFLRKVEGKDHAVIHDILAAAPPEEDGEPFARKLVARELLRHKEFAEHARNRDEALDAIRPIADRLGIDIDRLDVGYILDL